MDVKKLLVVLTALAVLTGCGQPAPVLPVPGVTLAPPTPAGMEEVPPEPIAPVIPDDDCRGSLRPFPTKSQADAAV